MIYIKRFLKLIFEVCQVQKVRGRKLKNAYQRGANKQIINTSINFLLPSVNVDGEENWHMYFRNAGLTLLGFRGLSGMELSRCELGNKCKLLYNGTSKKRSGAAVPDRTSFAERIGDHLMGTKPHVGSEAKNVVVALPVSVFLYV